MAYKRLLVGTDGSEPSLISVRDAAQLAKAVGAELLILTVFPPADHGTVERFQSDVPEELAWRFTPAGVADEAIEKARAVALEEGVEPRWVTERGEPAEMLIRVADQEDADLIVMGNRGMTGPSRFLLGSVPNKVSHAAPCDVLIVKTIP